jgi:tetratricopeptide (TPR) repeat protein
MAVRRFRPRLRWPHAGRRSGVDPAYERLVRLWLPIAQPGGLPARRTPRALLAPEAGLSRFEGRDDERADLLRWCTDGAEAPVRLLVGPAGVGKTRLAVELARALPDDWATGIARPGTAAQIVPAAAGGRRPVLIIVDDADTEPAADIAALLGHAAAASDRVRVLLVARRAEVLGSPAAPECTSLRAGGTDDDRRRVFAAAVRAFSGLPADAPLPVWAEPDHGPVGADGEPVGTTVARAALATDDPGPALRTADLRELTRELLRDEQRRWAATAADPRWGLDGLAPDAQEEALLALLLHRPHRVDDAVATLRTLDRFRLGSDEYLHDVATWAGHLYPGPVGGRRLDPQPELVRWALYDAAFERHRSLLLAALGQDPTGYLPIARAAAGYPRLAASLDALLAVVPSDAVVEAAVAAGPPGLVLRDHLVAALAACSPSAVDVERLYPSTAAATWAPVRIALRRAAVRHLRAAADSRPDDVRACGSVADSADPAADSAGDPAADVTSRTAAASADPATDSAGDPALDATSQTATAPTDPAADSAGDTAADATSRTAAASADPTADGDPAPPPTGSPSADLAGQLRADPGGVGGSADVAGGRAALATALTALGRTLGDLRAHADALAPRREAVQIYRDLAAGPELATALTDLSASLRALGEHDDALATSREAVRRLRELAIADPERHGGDLARALTDLGTDLRDTCAHEDALDVSREAVQRCRDLAAVSPARHLPDLAVALIGLGADLRERRAHGDALVVSREAVRLYRDVAANSAERHSPDLARALTDLGVDLHNTGDHDEAVVACREAVHRFQELAADDPADHLPGLARGLTALSAALRAAGAYQAGLAAGRDTVRRYRELAAADPDRHSPGLARALTQLGISLRGLRSSDEALAVAGEAVQLTRELAAADPVRHCADLARALTELGISLRGLAAHPDALFVTSEAVRLGRDLAVGDPARHVADLARALISLGASLRALDRRPEALAHEGEAVAWWWHLTQRRPGEFDDGYREAQRRHFHTFSPYEQDPDGLLTTEAIARSRVLGFLESRRPTPAVGDDEGLQAAATA